MISELDNIESLPPLSDYRLRRLRLRIALNVLAVLAGIPAAALSRFERGEHPLSDKYQWRLDAALARLEREAA